MLNEKISKPYVLRRVNSKVKSIEVIISRALIDLYITSDEFFCVVFEGHLLKTKKEYKNSKKPEIQDKFIKTN